MATIRKSITFTEQQESWIKLQVEKGLYTNESEYIRDLIRKDQKNDFKLNALKQAIQEGENSGVTENSILDIMEMVEQNLSKNENL
jgi:antitoxin ParD1/3/4